MKIGIMQPYFLPYMGYFQLLANVDLFVVYDNIQFTRKGWIHRNRMLENGKDVYFSLPLKKDSDYLNIVDRQISQEFESYAQKLNGKIKQNYSKAPYYDQHIHVIQEILQFKKTNLFEFLLHSLNVMCEHLNIQTEKVISSSINIDHELKSEKKVLEICKCLKADTYINPIGGQALYNAEVFARQGVELKFLEPAIPSYKQFENDFLPNLSILDYLMFNDVETVNMTIKHNFKFI